MFIHLLGQPVEIDVSVSVDVTGVTATVRRNGVVVAGTGITSLVVDQICRVRIDPQPVAWAASDRIAIELAATDGDEIGKKVLHFLVVDTAFATPASQESVDNVSEQIDDIPEVNLQPLLDAIQAIQIPEVNLQPVIEAINNSGLTTEQKSQLLGRIDYIYDLYHVLPPDRPPLPPMTDPATPGMVTLRVVLRDGTTLRPNENVIVKMLETRSVYLDGAHEVDKTYPGTTNQYGVADIPVFASTRLHEKGYNGIYSVKANGVDRLVWVTAEGGELGELPKKKP